jgi:hypothetical protein
MLILRLWADVFRNPQVATMRRLSLLSHAFNNVQPSQEAQEKWGQFISSADAQY